MSLYEPYGSQNQHNEGSGAISGASTGAAAGTAISPGWGTAIGAGIGAAAGMFGSGGSYRSRNRDARKAYQYAERYQPRVIAANNRADMLSRVNAAKEAGLHPLFALGGSAGQSGQPAPIPGQSNRGSRAADGLAAIAEGFHRYAEMQQKSDLVDRQIAASALQLALQNSQNDEPTIPTKSDVPGTDLVKIEPAKQVSRTKQDSSLQAGNHALWKKFEVLPGVFIEFPGEEPSEALENPALALATLHRNQSTIAKLGIPWAAAKANPLAVMKDLYNQVLKLKYTEKKPFKAITRKVITNTEQKGREIYGRFNTDVRRRKYP